jgi:hypothetical protein
MTTIEVCEDETCRCYDKQLVDRGYGFPVCPSTVGLLSPDNIKPMNPAFEGMYNKEQE